MSREAENYQLGYVRLQDRRDPQGTREQHHEETAFICKVGRQAVQKYAADVKNANARTRQAAAMESCCGVALKMDLHALWDDVNRKGLSTNMAAAKHKCAKSTAHRLTSQRPQYVAVQRATPGHPLYEGAASV